jgi:NAD(P)-dependent dehydrogenase (short-subunit alcohol dehydrogenase family)
VPKTIMIVGFGPGTATAVAEKFGEGGFSVALIGRNEDRLNAGVSALKAKGISASAIPADAADPASIRAAVRSVRSQLGPITILHWNAYGGMEAGDLLTADQASLHKVFDVAVFGLLAATDEALPDLKRNGEGAILISNGAFGVVSPEVDEAVINLHLMGLALSSAAKHKLVGLLAQRLKGDGVYVGEVMVYHSIKGTGSTDADSVDPTVIAEKHWELYNGRGETRAVVK